MAENNEKQIKGPPASFHFKVWRHFGFYETVDGKALDKDYAICKNCFAKIKYNSNTTNLQMHLVRYHGELLSAQLTQLRCDNVAGPDHIRRSDVPNNVPAT
ncbi:hypothetical protein QQF64_020297 [Cirrhinus molitorella]|uniref:BED-type domain-containing protein n=1 Tax=Cirrhinus molitorella TaxID=172907 RepID=A0ABR3L8W8_9TELE